jgi:REP element-mobilizing transposase RayT
MSYYERHLPHWLPEGATLFVTWRLHGSLSSSTASPKPEDASAGQAFREFDQALDKATTGPQWLKDSRIAQCVISALCFGDEQLNLYQLISYVVMSNHVHILIRPHTSLPRIMKTIKGFTAREANRLLGRTGHPFWQDESYDHWVRNETEFRRIVKYIERNPVSAGLVKKAEEWPWSSAAK